MNNKILKLLTHAGIWTLLMVSGCSLFPDKEKQYLQHSELEPLELPPDLQQKSENEQVANGGQVQQQQNQEEESGARTDSIDTDQIPMLVDIRKEPIHIQLFEGFDSAWRTVGKTLTHMGLEVLDRDKDNGQFFVVYEKAAKPVDDSLWSFLTFWRDDSQHEEYDFRVKLLEDVDSTKILILDANDQPVTEGPGRNLLQQIYQAL